MKLSCLNSTEDIISGIFSDSVTLQYTGCLELCEKISINSQISPEFKSDLITNIGKQTGIIPRLITLTRDFEHEKVQYMAYSVLLYIVSSDNCDRSRSDLQLLINNGCIESIIDALASDNESIKPLSLLILSHLSQSVSFKHEIISRGALPSIIWFCRLPLVPKPADVSNTNSKYRYDTDIFIEPIRFSSSILRNLCYGQHRNNPYYLVDILETLKYLIQSDDETILTNTLYGLQQLVKLTEIHDSPNMNQIYTENEMIINQHRLLFAGFMRESKRKCYNGKNWRLSADVEDIILSYHSMFVCSINDNQIISRLVELFCHKSDKIKSIAIDVINDVIIGNHKRYVINNIISDCNLFKNIENLLKIDKNNLKFTHSMFNLFKNLFAKKIIDKQIINQLVDSLINSAQYNPQIISMIMDLFLADDETHHHMLHLLMDHDFLSKLIKKEVFNDNDILCILNTIQALSLLDNGKQYIFTSKSDNVATCKLILNVLSESNLFKLNVSKEIVLESQYIRDYMIHIMKTLDIL